MHAHCPAGPIENAGKQSVGTTIKPDGGTVAPGKNILVGAVDVAAVSPTRSQTLAGLIFGSNLTTFLSIYVKNSNNPIDSGFITANSSSSIDNINMLFKDSYWSTFNPDGMGGQYIFKTDLSQSVTGEPYTFALSCLGVVMYEYIIVPNGFNYFKYYVVTLPDPIVFPTITVQ